MGKQMASALEVRSGENESGLKQNREVQAYSRQTQGRKARTAAYAGKQGKPMEAQAKWGGGEAVISWEMRCADLGRHNWARVAASPDAWRAVRTWADALDHDEARPIGWGKVVTIEARKLGRDHIYKFEVSGEVRYRYHVKAAT